jgi:hypothetical protein
MLESRHEVRRPSGAIRTESGSVNLLRKIFITISVLLVTCLLLSMESARATGTTHIWAPSADVQPFKLWHITSDMYIPVEAEPDGSHIATITNIGLTVGVLPLKKLNMEIGFDHKTGLGKADNYPLYANAKLGVPEGAWGKSFPAFALGVLDVGTRRKVTDYNVVYFKVAETITIHQTTLGRASIGYFTGNSSLLVDEDGRKDNAGIMIALERTVSELSDKLWLCVDYMGTHSVYGCWNLGGAWRFAPNVTLLTGCQLYTNAAVKNTVTLQVDVDF